jgi:CRP-like cAMP-binding protein
MSILRAAAPSAWPRYDKRPTLSDTVLAPLVPPAVADSRLFTGTNLTMRRVNGGDLLVREGDPSGFLYFLAGGWACRFTSTPDGKRQIPAILVGNDICNLDILAFDQIGYGVKMLTPGVVLSLPVSEARSLRAASQELAWAFAWLGFVDNAILTQRAMWLARLSARDRLVHLLCELSVRLGFEPDDTTGSFEVPMTQEMLGDVLGLTAVHVNRTVQQLRHEGLLVSGMHRTIVSDIAGLRRSILFDDSYLHRGRPQG